MPDEPSNLNKPEIQISHAELERWDADLYKSKCPACEDGILLIRRDEKTFAIQRQDRCISCGQQFYYTDLEINGERFNVPFPMFELVGPPCEVPGCKGILVNTIHLKTWMFFKKCSTCGQEFYTMSAREAMGWARRTIERALKKEKVN
jgi:hypothetical protein